MDHVPFGRSGLSVPRLGLGAGPLGDGALADAEAARLLHDALDAGVTLVDTAPSYGRSEERIGRHLAGRRGEFVLSTKVGYGVPGVPDWTGPCIAAGIDLALQRLRTERLDVVHLHSCPAEVALREDVVRALFDAREAGKVGAVAYSGDNEPLDVAISSGVFDAIEASVNVVDQRALRVSLPEATARGLGVLAKRPLANAPWRDAAPPDAADRRVYYERWRALDLPDPGLPPAELFVRFAAFAPGVHCALVGTHSSRNLRAAVDAVGRGPLPEDLLAALLTRCAERGADWPGLV